MTGNTISGFDKAGVQYHTVGTAAFDTVTTCGNTISNAPFGIRFQLSNASTVGEAVVCNNVFGAGVTTKVATDKVTHFRGTGTPEGAVAALIGGEFIRTDEADRLYVKQTSSGDRLGWQLNGTAHEVADAVGGGSVGGEAGLRRQDVERRQRVLSRWRPAG